MPRRTISAPLPARKVEHRFTIENIYEEDIHITSVASGCGCTTPQISKRS